MLKSISPRLTEKSHVLSQGQIYAFSVNKGTSKQEIAKSVAESYKVKVIDVRILNRKGKPTKFSRGKHAYPGTSYRQDKRIAYVRIDKNDKLPFFDDINAEIEKQNKAEEKK